MRNSRRRLSPHRTGRRSFKAGYYGHTGHRDARGRWQPSGMPQYYRYWMYEPGPVSGTFACKEIGYSEYPLPALVATGGEALILEVAALADESCRNWVRVWREGNTFMRTQAMTAKHSDGTSLSGHRFQIGAVRPATGEFALVHIDHKQQSIHRQLGGSDWSDAPIYMIYTVADDSCRETEYSTKAWHAWPEILPVNGS